ncbi:MAG: hypothetical protein OHK0044_06950 [Burkholderiaceae bacterium]
MARIAVLHPSRGPALGKWLALRRCAPSEPAQCDLGSLAAAAVAGCVVAEGHVPAREIGRLLAKRPDALDFAVLGMPVGSPAWTRELQRASADRATRIRSLTRRA